MFFLKIMILYHTPVLVVGHSFLKEVFMKSYFNLTLEKNNDNNIHRSEALKRPVAVKH